MKTRLFALFAVLFLCLLIAVKALATNQTPNDRHLKAVDRTVADEIKMYSLALTDATVSNVNLSSDVKSASVKCVGEDVLLNVSYYDSVATSHNVGDLISTGTDKRIVRVFDGESFLLAQEYEFTHVYARIADSSGSATCYFYPGGGLSQ